jgi:hypothetical protein
MPAQSSPRFPRGFGGGFGPLLGGGSSAQHMRVSDAERQAVADRLAEHYSEGRLDQAEFDERVGRAMSAKTRADLNGLFDDLPQAGYAHASGVPADTGGPWGPEGPGSGTPVRRHRRGHGLLAVVLVGFVLIAAAHAVFWLTVPWLWLGFLAVVVLAATGRLHRR